MTSSTTHWVHARKRSAAGVRVNAVPPGPSSSRMNAHACGKHMNMQQQRKTSSLARRWQARSCCCR
eukprot:364788-Chlamydomonas_euryale.AAC.8